MNKSLLLIEEDVTLRELTAFRLELLAHRVIAVESGEQGLTRIAEELPDAILVDQFLPDMKGVDLIDRLSNEIRTSDVPVMLLSPNAELDDVQRAFNAGADDFLVTPFDPQTLEKKLDRLTEATGA